MYVAFVSSTEDPADECSQKGKRQPNQEAGPAKAVIMLGGKVRCPALAFDRPII